MKILQLCNKVPYPPKDGGAMAIHNLIKGFSEAGHDIKVLTFHTSKHPVDVKAVSDYFSSFNVQVIPVNLILKISLIKAITNLIFSNIPYNISRYKSTEFNERLKTLFLNDSFDIVQLEGANLLPYIKTIRKYSNAKIAFRAHNIEHEIWQRYGHNEKTLVKKIYIKLLAARIRNYEKKNLNLIDILVPITIRDRDKFFELGNKKPVFVCPYTFDFSFNLSKLPENNHNDLFFIGSLDWLPNQEGILWFLKEVWNEILSKNPQVTFWLAGRNAPEKFIRKLHNKNVNYMGEVDDAGKFMNGKGILVAPLFSGSGMRVKIVEAMALGKTVITTSIGAEGIEAVNEVHLIIADTSKDFKLYLDKLINDENYCLQIGKNASTFVKDHFDGRRIIAGLLNFYKKECDVS